MTWARKCPVREMGGPRRRQTVGQRASGAEIKGSGAEVKGSGAEVKGGIGTVRSINGVGNLFALALPCRVVE